MERVRVLTTTIDKSKFPRPITASMGKFEEVQVMTDLMYLFAGSQTYLESFFSSAMVDWFMDQTRQDMSCNMMAEYLHDLNTNNDLRNKLSILGGKLEGRDNDVKRLEDKIALIQSAVAQKSVEIAQERSKDRTRIEDLRSMLAEESNKLEEKSRANEALEQEILSLKAQMFDMMQMNLLEPIGQITRVS